MIYIERVKGNLSRYGISKAGVEQKNGSKKGGTQSK